MYTWVPQFLPIIQIAAACMRYHEKIDSRRSSKDSAAWPGDSAVVESRLRGSLELPVILLTALISMKKQIFVLGVK